MQATVKERIDSGSEEGDCRLDLVQQPLENGVGLG